MHDNLFLINVIVAIAAAFLGGFFARKAKLPPIVGYLLAGIVIGPFTPGFVGDPKIIQELAELGVLFLMFGVGMHFSFKELWSVKAIALPGAILQMFVCSLLGFFLGQLWGWSFMASVIVGLSVCIASTVVLLRGLMDKGGLNSSAGQTAVGWLVVEDLATVVVLVLLPLFEVHGAQSWINLLLTLGKAALFVLFMLILGKRIVPWLLRTIVKTRSRELFILAVLTMAIGFGIAASLIFGISMALGAFLAGVVVSESPLRHQAEADTFSFKEAFSALFFVSIGMLVNPVFLWQNLSLILSFSLLVILGKAIITLIFGFSFAWPIKTTLMIAAGLSQIGEFSFILGQTGLSSGFINAGQYSLILAVALISITLNPFVFRLVDPCEKVLNKISHFWERGNRKKLIKIPPNSLANHVVVVGHGRVGFHVVQVLQQIKQPFVVIDSDIAALETLSAQGIPVLCGDAASSNILDYAELSKAKALVITIPDETSALIILESLKNKYPQLILIVRASTDQGVNSFSKLGVTEIVHPEFDGGLEILRRTLFSLGYSLKQVETYTLKIRKEHIASSLSSDGNIIESILKNMKDFDIQWFDINRNSFGFGKSLKDLNLRAVTGCSAVALEHEGGLFPNPSAEYKLCSGDRLAVIGQAEQLEKAILFFKNV